MNIRVTQRRSITEAVPDRIIRPGDKALILRDYMGSAVVQELKWDDSSLDGGGHVGFTANSHARSFARRCLLVVRALQYPIRPGDPDAALVEAEPYDDGVIWIGGCLRGLDEANSTTFSIMTASTKTQASDDSQQALVILKPAEWRFWLNPSFDASYLQRSEAVKAASPKVFLPN